MDEAKLGALGRMVSDVDGQSPDAMAEVQAQQEAQAQAVSEAKAWAQVPYAVGRLLCMVAPELEPFYTEKACEAWGEAMVPVAQKYGWNASVFPEIGLAISTAGFAIPSYMMLKAKLAALKEQGAAGRQAQQRKEGGNDGG